MLWRRYTFSRGSEPHRIRTGVFLVQQVMRGRADWGRASIRRAALKDGRYYYLGGVMDRGGSPWEVWQGLWGTFHGGLE